MTSELFDLRGRNAVVTGAGQGLGRAMAAGLAGHGANVAVVEINDEAARDATEELAAMGVESFALHADVTSEEEVNEAFAAVVARWGSVDILVNNAGMSIMGAAETMSVADFTRVFEIDVFGVFICSKAAFPLMERAGGGSIVNIASMTGVKVLRPQEHASYNAAKSSVIMLTKSLAVEWAAAGIRVNAIAPGYMLTPPLEQMRSDDPERWQTWIDQVPLGRIGDPRDLQGAAVYLSGDASRYVTGTVMLVDGGHTCA